MLVKYNIVLTIIHGDNSSKISKDFEYELNALNDNLLYNNYHIISRNNYIIDMFKDELDAYCKAESSTLKDIIIDEFEIVSLSNNIDVFFESEPYDETHSNYTDLSLCPTIKAYVHPKIKELSIPILKGEAYDSHTIIWSWNDYKEHAHYLVEEAIDINNANDKDKIIAQLPIGCKSYTETNLEPNTAYTRRLISYTDELYSQPSASVTVMTETANIHLPLKEYKVPKLYDFTTDDKQRETITKRLKAFHSGIGDFNDLKVYKQMDADFYQKFKAYLEITGKRTQREKRYDQVGFNYKICLEGLEQVEEQEGEVTFDINVYPREETTIKHYMYATHKVNVYAKLYATALLMKENTDTQQLTIKTLKDVYTEIPGTPGTPSIPGKPVYGTTFIGSPLNFIFVLDVTGSMKNLPNDIGNGFDKVRTAISELIGNIRRRKNDLQKTVTTDTEIKVTCSFITFGYFANCNEEQWFDLDENTEEDGSLKSNSRIQKILEGYNRGCYDGGSSEDKGCATNWDAGLCACTKLIEVGMSSGHGSSPDNYIVYFFSDGFPNTTLSGDNYWNANDATIQVYPRNTPIEDSELTESGEDTSPNNNCQCGCSLTSERRVKERTIINSIQSYRASLESKCHALACVIPTFGSSPNNYIQYVDPSSGWNGKNYILYPECYIIACHQAVAGSKGKMFRWSDTQSLISAFNNDDFLNGLLVQKQIGVEPDTPGIEETPGIMVPSGYEEQIETVNISYNIDDVKVVSIESDLLGPFEFNNDITPVYYDDKEQRAVIYKQDIIKNNQKVKLDSNTIYDLLMPKIEQTNEYQDGYNKPMGTSDGSILIKDLYIKDTYMYADEDINSPIEFDESDNLEDGLVGSINVFTDIETVQTDTKGDDYYLVSQDNYVYISGYTDAIIYDGTRFVTTELNAYNHQTDILIDNDDNYSSLLYNRQSSANTYDMVGGTNDLINSVVTVIEKDKDIYFTGYEELENRLIGVNDVIKFNGITDDLIAHNDVIYKSPILNYRFNLEDPDAKTPLCEILPNCNPNSPYLNIVILHIYYAKNVYISNTTNDYFIKSYGNNDLDITEHSPYLPLKQGFNEWSLMEWKDKQDNGKYIDEYIWFMAKPMTKIQDYYDELPGKGMNTFYGLVNGRYRTDNQDGKKDLIVDTPQFNIPTTVLKDSIRIYIMITEFQPKDALISYKCEHPLDNKNGITNYNGDYVTFSSDSVTYKDIDYYDIIQTINMENQEVFNHDTTQKLYNITKPKTTYEYTNYYLKISTDNSDVIALRYPNEIIFDSNDTASITACFKGVVNATSKWSPRIHNGYYYLNQHEYYAYCKSSFKADFATYEEKNFKTISGYINIDVTCRHKYANIIENYSIVKNTRSELLQDENKFQWINDKGLTLKPTIDTLYYREYIPYFYYSPVLMFNNILTTAGNLKVDGSSLSLPMQVRSYIVDDGKWSDWTDFTNNTVPNVPLSCAYQVKFILQASVQNRTITQDDYMCCYLDWKEDMNENNTTNISIITDHMQTGSYKGKGIYISKVLDFGCISELKLDMFDSHYKEGVQLYLAYTNTNPDNLLLENVSWTNITYRNNTPYKARYFRYKIEIPYGEKLYWLHKTVTTKETHEQLPFVKSISMTGTYAPTDIVNSFINTESFEIPKDGNYHTVFDSILEKISADVATRDFELNEIETVNIACTTPNIVIDYNTLINTTHYPLKLLNSPLKAMSNIDYNVLIKSTPFIFVSDDCISIVGTPQQYSPITVEDKDGHSFIELHDTSSLLQKEEIKLQDETKYIELKTNRYDKDTLEVYIDDKLLDTKLYHIVNHIIIFNNFIPKDSTITITYYVLYSFIALIDRKANTTVIYPYTKYDVPIPDRLKVYFETSERNNKFIANDLSLNPIYRTEYSGFVYLTDDHNSPYKINIFCNPKRLKAGGYDKVDISVEVLDILNNPIIAKRVDIDCNAGIINMDTNITDMNGVVHIVYESSVIPSTDIITAKVLDDDNKLISNSIKIVNE